MSGTQPLAGRIQGPLAVSFMMPSVRVFLWIALLLVSGGAMLLPTTAMAQSVTASGAPLSGVAPLSVAFTATPSAGGWTPPLTWAWDFGDGGTATVQNPTYSYGTPGVYTATVTVTDSGAPAIVRTATVGPITVFMAVDITATPTCGEAYLNVCFSATAGGTGPFSYDWDFGDGTYPAPDFNDPLPCHTFTTPNTSYMVSVRMVDSLGNFGIGTALITTSPLNVNPCVTPTNGPAPLLVQFNNGCGFVSGGIPPYSYVWDFGDGSALCYDWKTQHGYNDPGTYHVTLTVTDSCVPPTVVIDTHLVIKVVPGALAGTATVDRFCGPAPTNACFAGTAIGGTPPYAYSWNFGDGSPAVAGPTPCHTYTTPGNYTVAMTVTDAVLATSVDSHIIMSIADPLTISTSVSRNNGYAPFTAYFSSAVTGGTSPFTYLWDFGDGTTSALVNPSHVYQPGYYTVKLTVTDGCTPSETTSDDHLRIVVYPVQVTATSNFTCGVAPLNVIFTGDAVGGQPPYTWAWTFGDGGTDTQQNPSHSYLTAGTYTAHATATDALGVSGTASVVVNVLTPLSLTVHGLPATVGPAPLTVNVSSVVSGGLAPYTYDWDFADGSQHSLSPSDQHTWATPGIYAVALTVTDACANTVTKTLEINAYGPITAVPTVNQGCGYAPLNVILNAGASGGVPPYTAYSWSFGDGTPGDSIANPSHSYLALGNFTATVTVTDSLGHMGSGSVAISVTAPLAVTVAGLPATSGPSPLTVNVSSVVTGGTPPYTYDWDFADGSQHSVADHDQHTWIQPGTYDVVLTVKDSCGHTVTADLPVNAYGAVTPTPTADVMCGYAPLNVVFTGTTTGGVPPYTYAWAFGDGGHDTQANPSHSYLAVGDFTATLTVTDSLGHSGTGTLSVSVTKPLAVAVQGLPVTTGPAPLTVNVSSVVIGGTPPYTYSWDFGDGSTVVVTPAAQHTWIAEGSYEATLTVGDSCGHTATAVLPINAYAPVAPTITPSATCGTVPINVCFTPSATGGLPPYIYAWSFGDGTPPSSDQLPCHNYLAPNTYTVILTATDSVGNVGSTSATIRVVPLIALQVAASADTTFGLAPLLVHFSKTVSGGSGPFTYAWNFGDGTPTDTSSAPDHLYQTAGAYTVTLTVSTQDACGKVYTATSPAVQIQVMEAPAITMTSPVDGHTYGASVTFQSTVYDNVLVLRVKYYANGFLLGWATAAPYTFVWDTTGMNGTVSVSATVEDSAGRTASTPAISINFGNPTLSGRIQGGGSPYTLKAFGSGFMPGAIVLINGVRAPLSVVKSSTKIVAKGDAMLKAMLPKGVPVTIQVQNPDGGITGGATFVR